MKTKHDQRQELTYAGVLARMRENRAKARLNQEMLERELRHNRRGGPFISPPLEHTPSKALMPKEAGLDQQGQADEAHLDDDAEDRAVNAGVAGRHWEANAFIAKVQKDRHQSDG